MSAGAPPPGTPERRDQRERADDRRLLSLVRIGAVLGVVLVLAVGVIGVVAGMAASSATDAADKATEAADTANQAARKATRAVERAKRNAATVKDLCAVARQQRRTLELNLENSLAYLESPAGQQPGGLNDFIRGISLPQLRARLEAERVPPSCRRLAGVRSSP